MKQYGSGLLMAALLIASLIACNDAVKPLQQGADSSGNQPQTSGKTVAANTGSIPNWQEVDSCYARGLFDHFNKLYRQRLAQAFPNVQIPTNIWFDSTFIHYLHKRIQDSGYSGIRIYWGAYPDSIAPIVRTVRMTDVLTVFVVETKLETRKGVEAHYDQFRRVCPSPKGPVESYNHGHLCPPDNPKSCSGAYFQ